MNQIQEAVKEEDIDTYLLRLLGVTENEDDMEEFARESFPKGCEFYANGELTTAGKVIADLCLRERKTGQYTFPCMKCDAPCKIREKPYQN